MRCRTTSGRRCSSLPPRRSRRRRLLGDVDLAPAVDAGVVEVADERIRFTHPLLAATLVGDASPARLRDVHARLAELVTDPEHRARHRAAAATGPDESVAAALEEAAHAAFRRGAPAAAGELLERSLVLTDPDDVPARARRAGRPAATTPSSATACAAAS